MIADEARHYYGLMFHPEVVHTPDGAAPDRELPVPRRRRPRRNWTMAAFREEAIARIREQVGSSRVICGLSGGGRFRGCRRADPRGYRRPAYLRVPSITACCAPARPPEVVGLFRDHYNIPLVHADVSDMFLGQLAGVTDPRAQAQDHRRPVHRRLRCRSQEARRRRFPGPRGTLYPDVIESVSATGGPAVTIKSHHNVGGLPDRMKMKLVEPLRALFKDEVRVLGRTLGLPPAFRRPPSVPGTRPRHPLPRRGHEGEARHPAPGRQHLPRRDPPRRSLRRDLASLSRSCCRCGPWA